MDLKRTAELYLRSPVKDAVVSIPTWFNCSQREAMKLAVRSAGLNLLRLIHEPSATLLSYSHSLRHPNGLSSARKRDSTRSSRPRTIVSIDLGAGSLDVAVARMEDGVVEVLGVTGSPDTGGDFFDFRILDHFLGEFRRKHNIGMWQKRPSTTMCRIDFFVGKTFGTTLLHCGAYVAHARGQNANFRHRLLLQSTSTT